MRFASHQCYRRGHDKNVNFVAALVIQRSLALHGAEKQKVESHRDPEQNSTHEQPLRSCHSSVSRFALHRNSASPMPLFLQLREV